MMRWQLSLLFFPVENMEQGESQPAREPAESQEVRKPAESQQEAGLDLEQKGD